MNEDEQDRSVDMENRESSGVVPVKRYLCARRSFVYNPVSNRCQPTLMVRQDVLLFIII